MRTYWLSFCDTDKPEGSQFLGACVVDVTDADADAAKADIGMMFPNHADGAEWIAAASRKSWLCGCNPGGQMLSVEMPEGHPALDFYQRNRLFTKDEIERIDADIKRAGVA